MADINEVWPRIERHAGAEFETITGLKFTYRVPGRFVRVTRNGHEINRSLSAPTSRRRLRECPPPDRATFGTVKVRPTHGES